MDKLDDETEEEDVNSNGSDMVGQLASLEEVRRVFEIPVEGVDDIEQAKKGMRMRREDRQ